MNLVITLNGVPLDLPSKDNESSVKVIWGNLLNTSLEVVDLFFQNISDQQNPLLQFIRNWKKNHTAKVKKSESI